jgi:hypothetical protein
MAKENEINFEKMLARLEEIVRRLKAKLSPRRKHRPLSRGQKHYQNAGRSA